MGQPWRATLAGLSPPISSAARAMPLPAQPQPFGGFAMGKRGPNPRPEKDLRQHQFGVYFTSAERDRLIALAVPGDPSEFSDLGTRRYVAAYMRQAALRSLPSRVPAINREAWAELARVAANLNQHQRSINEGRALPDLVDLADLRTAVDALRNELLGVCSESED